MLNGEDYPEASYRRAMGIIQLHKDYGSERLNNACERAMYGESFSYNRVKNILKNQLDQQPIQTDLFENATSHIPKHDNIRGASSYQ
jgi:hypothetical protein